MLTIENLDIHNFVESGNKIIIHFNESLFEELFPSLSFKEAFGKWLFITKTDETVNFDPHECHFKEEKFNLSLFYEELLKLQKNFNLLFPKEKFPCIVIVSSKLLSSACLAETDSQEPIIYIREEELENIERFKFTIGHELGHIIYSGYFESLYVKQINSLKFKSLFPWEIFIMCISLMFFSSSGFITNDFVILIFSMFIFGLSGTILISHLFSFNRIKKYQMEFFCDYFSTVLSGKINTKNMGLHGIPFNLMSHPSCLLRAKSIKNNFNSIHDWQSPIFTNPFYFRILSFYEFSYFYLNLIDSFEKLFTRKKPKK